MEKAMGKMKNFLVTQLQAWALSLEEQEKTLEWVILSSAGFFVSERIPELSWSSKHMMTLFGLTLIVTIRIKWTRWGFCRSWIKLVEGTLFWFSWTTVLIDHLSSASFRALETARTSDSFELSIHMAEYVHPGRHWDLVFCAIKLIGNAVLLSIPNGYYLEGLRHPDACTNQQPYATWLRSRGNSVDDHLRCGNPHSNQWSILHGAWAADVLMSHPTGALIITK